MALLKVAIKKRVNFQGNSAEEFGNVYTFTVDAANEANARTLIDGLVVAERRVYSTAVSFVEGRAFTDKETQGFFDSAPETYLITEPAVFGSAVASDSIYRECAYLVKFPLARKRKLAGGLGRQRMLKKWIHATSLLGGAAAGTWMSGSTPLEQPTITALEAYAADVADVGGFKLTSVDGTIPGPAVVHKYLEHHQFPPGRREDNVTLTP